MINALTKTVFGHKLNESFTLADTLKFLSSKGLLNEGELAELAISKKSGIAKCPACTPEIDLVNGIQIKHARSHPRSSGNGQVAYISIKNTKATIFAVVTESVTGKQYFLHIPYKARQHLCGNTISIPFDNYGGPGNSQWWLHEVGSFDQLCELAKNA